MKSLKSLSSFSVLFAIGIGAVILIFPQAALEGVRSGAELCMNVVVPSLFPFMVVSIFVSGFALPKRISGAVSAVMRLLFRLPFVLLCYILYKGEWIWNSTGNGPRQPVIWAASHRRST